ncbi:hypothetical protein PAAG_05930 [Paracoccidioides lutzii Pb01]|uniref:Uncharacterized protein n=1 Tax=Paracoccidioides lutzii (strain ATCC MYA-826 / Pb01) TaxID=502779 RepID=C1H589_PARBA|nr:hypothetical protein PAAG_05930 [Paracoccidioides lutzii Pb01]EEH34883.2 hypothetical protein PAAG_05930 [Paracoccidioides lutzii Pb01]
MALLERQMSSWCGTRLRREQPFSGGEVNQQPVIHPSQPTNQPVDQPTNQPHGQLRNQPGQLLGSNGAVDLTLAVHWAARGYHAIRPPTDGVCSENGESSLGNAQFKPRTKNNR